MSYVPHLSAALYRPNLINERIKFQPSYKGICHLNPKENKWPTGTTRSRLRRYSNAEDEYISKFTLVAMILPSIRNICRVFDMTGREIQSVCFAKSCQVHLPCAVDDRKITHLLRITSSSRKPRSQVRQPHEKKAM
jgi:hypothetical protein